MKELDISFEENDTDITMGMDLPEELEGSEAELELGGLDLGSLDTEFLTPNNESINLTSKQKMDAVVEKLSNSPEVLAQLSKGITTSRLGLLSNTVGYDVSSEYKGNKMFNMFINAISQGIVVSDNFREGKSNTLRLHYVPASKSDSIHLHKMGDVQVYKSTPAITDFTEEQLASVSPMYKGKLESFSTLHKRLQDSCYRPIATKASDSGMSILAMDNLTLADKVARSTNSSKSLGIIKKAGCDSERLNKISILAKSIKDNK